MIRKKPMSPADARRLLEAALLRLSLSSAGSIRIDKVEGRAIELLLGELAEAEADKFEAGDSEDDEPLQADTVGPPYARVSVLEQPCAMEEVELDLSAADPELGFDPEARLCVDFGTAFTKAYAMRGWSDPVDLELGSYAGSESPLMVESSVWIDEDGIYFGPQAIAKNEEPQAGRRRFDSMKRRLLQLDAGQSLGEPVGEDINPWAGQLEFTELGLLTLYLAYVTRLLSTALEDGGLPKHLPRRITHPCWEGPSGEAASQLLRRLMAKAIILADTLGDSLVDGLGIEKAAGALDAVDALDDGAIQAVEDAVLQEGLSEPEAVAAPFEADRDWHFLTVVDVGAGTTDFATFLLRAHPNWERGKIMLVPGTRASLDKAGDELDRILFEQLTSAFSAELDATDMPTLKASLQSTIRDNKLSLFRDGWVVVEHEGIEIKIELDEFLLLDEVEALGEEMKAVLRRTFAAMPKHLAEKLVEKGGVKLLLSGGGATLPMARELASENYFSGTGTIRARLMEVRPDWVSSKDDAFQSVYPQVAVAVGGASPFLPTRTP